jgi:hypothetical protein
VEVNEEILKGVKVSESSRGIILANMWLQENSGLRLILP